MAAARTAVERHLASVLSYFPPVEYAFAYGSGVHVQPGLYADAANATIGGGAGSNDRPIIDHIFAVEDPYDWHKLNMQHNPKHYAWPRMFGSNTMAGIAEYIGAGIHFNTMVKFGEQTIKYGVISTKVLQHDLTAWQDLYIAGRMQKPIVELKHHAGIAEAQQRNLHAATATAMLLLPAKFSSQDLLRTIVGLSYKGDIRVGLAEDPRKIERIVEGSEAGLRELYIPRLQALGHAPSVVSAKWTPFAARIHGMDGISGNSSGSSSSSNSEVGDNISKCGAQSAASSIITNDSSVASQPHSSNAGSSSAASSGSSISSTHSGKVQPAASVRINSATSTSLSIVQATGSDTWQRDTSPRQQFWLLQQLPANVLQHITLKHGFCGPQEHLVPGSSVQKEVITALQRRAQMDKEISAAVAAIVWRSSCRQAASGFLASGGARAVQYLYRKVSKTWGKTT